MLVLYLILSIQIFTNLLPAFGNDQTCPIDRNIFLQYERYLVELKVSNIPPDTFLDIKSIRNNTHQGTYQGMSLSADGRKVLILKKADGPISLLALDQLDPNSFLRPFDKLYPEVDITIKSLSGNIYSGRVKSVVYDNEGNPTKIFIKDSQGKDLSLLVSKLDESSLSIFSPTSHTQLPLGDIIELSGDRSFISFQSNTSTYRGSGQVKRIWHGGDGKLYIEVEEINSTNGQKRVRTLQQDEIQNSRVSSTAKANFAKFTSAELKPHPVNTSAHANIYKILKDDASGYGESSIEGKAFTAALNDSEAIGEAPKLFPDNTTEYDAAFSKSKTRNLQWIEEQKKIHINTPNIQIKGEPIKMTGGIRTNIQGAYIGHPDRFVVYRPLEQSTFNASTNNSAARYTLAASELNQMMGLETVPRAWPAKIEGKLVVVSEDAGALIAKPLASGRTALHANADFEAFEFLIGQTDGHLGNYYKGENGTKVMFDHDAAFNFASFDKRLAKVKAITNNIGNHMPTHYSKHFVDQLKSEKFMIDLRARLTMLSESEIQAIEFRRKVILKDIELRGPSVILP